MKENATNFFDFSVVVRCTLNDEDISISVSGEEGIAALYKFHNGGWFYHRYCKSKKIRDYIFHQAILSDIILYSSPIISNVTITFYSNYKSMTSKYRIQQPRKVLESKFLKHIKNASYDDKIKKYNFLAGEFKFI